MEKRHSDRSTEQLSQEKDTRGKLSCLDIKQRFQMLAPFCLKGELATACDELKTIKLLADRSGCRCLGGRCDPASCECAVAGIKCCDEIFPSGRHSCTCFLATTCWNRRGRLDNYEERQKAHFIRTISRLQQEEVWSRRWPRGE